MKQVKHGVGLDAVADPNWYSRTQWPGDRARPGRAYRAYINWAVAQKGSSVWTR